MMNLFNLSAKVTLNTEDYERSIGSVARQGQTTGTIIDGLSSTFDNLRKAVTNAKTQFTKSGLEEMTANLSDAGFEGKELYIQLNKFKSLGDIFGVQEDGLKEISKSYSDVQKKQSAYTEDLELLESKGVPIYKKLAENLGITITEVKNLAKEGKITAEQYNEAMDSMAEGTDKTNDKLKSIGNGFKNVATTTAKVFTGMATVASGAIAFLAKSAIENYAEYEQLVGGVETLFKDSSDKVMQYANNAYKTAGMTANDYMSTITGFSASLLQGLGGDTEKAVEIGNLAVTDMSDNANKIGTSMEMIQNAYQGFAKSNYTMLDNLKLG